MTWPASFFFPHTVKVRDVTGSGGMGVVHSPTARSLAAEVIDKQELVRNAAGEEVVSSTRVTVALDANVRQGALVTVWDGTSAKREAAVISVGRDENAPPLPSHLVLWLK